MAPKTVPTLKLNNNVQIPVLGFGTFSKEGTSGKTYSSVIAALDAGYRHLDCAWYYLNEDEVGAAMKDWLRKNPSVKREDIFITTKLWPHLAAEAEDVEWSLNSSLQRLRMSYVDCFLIHWPFVVEKTADNRVKLGPDGKYIIKTPIPESLERTWRAMEKLYRSGKVKSIGVSNFKIEHLEAMLKYAKVKPAVNQIEIHPFLPNNELIDYCKSHDILPVAYSPLGSQDQVPSTGEKVATNPELNALAEKKGVTLPQMLIAWGLRRGYVVLPKSSNAARIRSNSQLVEITDAEFEAINKVSAGRNHRFVNLKDMFGYNLWPEEAF